MVDAMREHVLPTGGMHLVFRLSEEPLRLFRDETDSVGQTMSHAMVGGARSTYYERDISQASASVGVLLQPGASELLFGVPAEELAGRHTLLEDLWGRAAMFSLRERLQEAPSAAQRAAILESALAHRLPAVRALHPAVAQALTQFYSSSDVREVVRASGYSHRRFLSLFRGTVGLSPKVYCRVQRFQQALVMLRKTPALSWVDLALAMGYSDQSHFSREFREFTGVTPEQYRLTAPAAPNHLPVSGRK